MWLVGEIWCEPTVLEGDEAGGETDIPGWGNTEEVAVPENNIIINSNISAEPERRMNLRAYMDEASDMSCSEGFKVVHIVQVPTVK